MNNHRWSQARRWQVTGLGLAVLAAAGPYLAASRERPEVDQSAERSKQAVAPVLSPPASSPTASAGAGPVLAERAQSSPRGGDLLARQVLDWYQAALLPAASVHDKTVAQHLDVLCGRLLSVREGYEEVRQAAHRPMPASVPGMSAEELAGMTQRKAMAAPAEQGTELQRLDDYCRPGQGFDLGRKLRKAGMRSTDYAELVLPSRAIEGRLPVVTNVLTNPQANALEFIVWADHGLRDVFERGHGLDELEAWHASRWLVREVLGNRPEVALFERTQCAVYGFCSSAITLGDAERQKADAAARRVLSDLQRQDWPRLILKSP